MDDLKTQVTHHSTVFLNMTSSTARTTTSMRIRCHRTNRLRRHVVLVVLVFCVLISCNCCRGIPISHRQLEEEKDNSEKKATTDKATPSSSDKTETNHEKTSSNEDDNDDKGDDDDDEDDDEKGDDDDDDEEDSDDEEEKGVSTTVDDQPDPKNTENESNVEESEKEESEEEEEKDQGGEKGGIVEKCEVIEVCKECAKHELMDIDECEATGKIERIECIKYQDGQNIQGKKEFRSCKRTEADEEFLMMRLQMFCFLLGSMSLFSAKRQKRIHASLFDQRKAKAKQSPARRNQQRQGPIETEMISLSLDSSVHSATRARSRAKHRLGGGDQQQQQREDNEERSPLVSGNTSGPSDMV